MERFLYHIHRKLRFFILGLIQFFYPPFKRIMPFQTFQYAACGGGNTALNIFIYFLSYNYVFAKKNIHLNFVVISPHIAAFILAFIITFPIGLYLNMFIVFKGSDLKKRIQLFRYFLVVLSCIGLNYILLKLFVEQWNWYPTPSMMVATLLTILFSYISQQKFSFKRRIKEL